MGAGSRYAPWSSQQVPAEVRLVEVVAYARCVREQMPDGHARIDELELISEHVPDRRIQRERSLRDERHYQQCRQAFRAARDAEPSGWGVGYPVSPIGQAARAFAQ